MTFSSFLRTKSHSPQLVVDLRRALHNAATEPTSLQEVLDCLHHYLKSQCLHRESQVPAIRTLWQQFERVKREAA